MRVEFIGCTATCVKSLGLCTNPVPDVPKIPDLAFTASSHVTGNEPSKARVTYNKIENFSFRSYYAVEVHQEKLDQAGAGNTCSSGGALISIHDRSQQDNIEGRLGHTDECYWVGLTRHENGAWYWSDGTVVDYTNWSPNKPMNKHCACMDGSDRQSLK